MLKDFLKHATKRERAEVAAACHNSVAYLYQIAGKHRFASPVMAINIELHTRLLARRTGGRLQVVHRATMVRHPQIFDDVSLVPEIGVAGGADETV